MGADMDAGEKYIYINCPTEIMLYPYGQRSALNVEKIGTKSKSEDVPDQWGGRRKKFGSGKATIRIPTSQAKDLWPPGPALQQLKTLVLPKTTAVTQKCILVNDETKVLQQQLDANHVLMKKHRSSLMKDHPKCTEERMQMREQLGDVTLKLESDVQQQLIDAVTISSSSYQEKVNDAQNIVNKSKMVNGVAEEAEKAFGRAIQDIHNKVIQTMHLLQKGKEIASNQFSPAWQSVKAHVNKTSILQTELSNLFKKYEIGIDQQLSLNNQLCNSSEDTKVQGDLKKEYEKRISLLRADRESGRKFYWKQIGFYQRRCYLLEKEVMNSGFPQSSKYCENVKSDPTDKRYNVNEKILSLRATATVSPDSKKDKIKGRKQCRLFKLFSSCITVDSSIQRGQEKCQSSFSGKDSREAHIEKQREQENNDLKHCLREAASKHKQTASQNEILKQQLQEYEEQMQSKEAEIERLRHQVDTLNEVVDSRKSFLHQSVIINTKRDGCNNWSISSVSDGKSVVVDPKLHGCEADEGCEIGKVDHESSFTLNIAGSVHDLLSNLKSELNQIWEKQMKGVKELNKEKCKVDSYLYNVENTFSRLVDNLRKTNEELCNIKKSMNGSDHQKKKNLEEGKKLFDGKRRKKDQRRKVPGKGCIPKSLAGKSKLPKACGSSNSDDHEQNREQQQKEVDERKATVIAELDGILQSIECNLSKDSRIHGKVGVKAPFEVASIKDIAIKSERKGLDKVHPKWSSFHKADDEDQMVDQLKELMLENGLLKRSLQDAFVDIRSKELCLGTGKENSRNEDEGKDVYRNESRLWKKDSGADETNEGECKDTTGHRNLNSDLFNEEKCTSSLQKLPRKAPPKPPRTSLPTTKCIS